MQPNSQNGWRIAGITLILVVVLSACEAPPGRTPSPSQPPAAGAPDSVDSPTATQTSDVSENQAFDASLELGPGSFDLPMTAVGLSDLASYQAALTLSFDGANAGQPEKWTKTYVMLVQKDPAARQLTIEKIGDLADLTPVFMAEMDGVAYEARGVDTCIANVMEEGGSLSGRMEPAGFLTAVHGADETGSETVNDVAAKHYTFDDRALGQMKRAKSTGEMWVASDSGYVVRYKVTTTGGADYFGEGNEGTLTWDYELTNVNQPVTVQLPADCPDGLVDAPLTPDATNIENLPGSLSFETSSSLADVALFYQEQLATLGWTLDDDPAITETSGFMGFTQGSRQMVITMTRDAGVTTLSIQLASLAPVE